MFTSVQYVAKRWVEFKKIMLGVVIFTGLEEGLKMDEERGVVSQLSMLIAKHKRRNGQFSPPFRYLTGSL